MRYAAALLAALLALAGVAAAEAPLTSLVPKPRAEPVAAGPEAEAAGVAVPAPVPAPVSAGVAASLAGVIATVQPEGSLGGLPMVALRPLPRPAELSPSAPDQTTAGEAAAADDAAVAETSAPEPSDTIAAGESLAAESLPGEDRSVDNLPAERIPTDVAGGTETPAPVDARPALRPRPRPAALSASDAQAVAAGGASDLVAASTPSSIPDPAPAAEVSRAPAANAIAAASLVSTTDVAATLRPRARPAALVRPSNPAREVAVVQVASAAAVLRSLRPEPRPRNLTRRALVLASAAAIQTQPDPRAITGRRGSVCGDPRIKGEILAPIGSRVKGCGIEAPVRVTEVDGVRLSMAATVDCTTAVALRAWVSEVVKPEVGRLGGGVAGLDVMGHYTCRTRNNQPGARVSEHGRGRAIDIGGIRLANGSTITVLRGWRDAQHGDLLRALHRGACGRFGTVLGPASDRFHQNHFHFDTARYRSGAFCR